MHRISTLFLLSFLRFLDIIIVNVVQSLLYIAASVLLLLVSRLMLSIFLVLGAVFMNLRLRLNTLFSMIVVMELVGCIGVT